MNLKDLHSKEKELSALSLFKGEIGAAVAIHLKENAMLKEHITKTPALLLCVSGSVIYEDETKEKVTLNHGDYFQITPNVKHWLLANSDAQLVLFK